jgi:hypothetical protein
MIRRIARALLVAILVAGGVGWHPQVAAQSSLPPCGIALRVLVVSKDGKEADLPAITTALEYVGTPYDVVITDTAPLPALETAVCAPSSSTESPTRALYQGIILTNNYAVGGYGQIIADYEYKFGIRQVNWFNTNPTPDDGLTLVSGGAQKLPATLTPEGEAVFPYIKTGATIDISEYAWTLFAKQASSDQVQAGSTTVPLLTYPDPVSPSPYVLAAIHTYADGRQNLLMTFDSNPYMLHSMLLSYGVINWVTSGLFIGERHTYVSPQIDDLFIDDEQWLASTACGTSVDNTGVSHRMNGADLTAVSDWQALRRRQPLTSGLKITMAFNGFGTSPDYDYRAVGGSDTLVIGGSTSGSTIDTLTPAAVQQQQNYYWTSHTYDHENLDNISYAAGSLELSRNIAVANQLGLRDFTLRFMVQPDVSGLANAEFLRAAYDNGIRYLVSNTSKAGQNNPTPNTGYWNGVNPGIFVIPRRANNLFFNVATPADWVKEYNCLYGLSGSHFFDHDLSYDEILDFISSELTADLLRGELDPWMFHQTNLAAFKAADGTTHTLLGDLLDRTFQKYGSYVTFPIVSPSIDVIGERMMHRTTLRTKGIDATVQPGVGIVFTSPENVTVPVTGLNYFGELYGGQWISWVPLRANVALTVPFSPPLSSDGVGTRSVTVSTSQPDVLLVAFVAAGGSSRGVQSATISGAGIEDWTMVRRVNDEGGTSEIWAKRLSSAVSNATITSTLALPAYRQTLTVMRFTGSGGIGASEQNHASSGAPNVSLVTQKRNSLIYGVGSDTKHAVPRTVPSNQWMVTQVLDTAAGDTLWLQALAAPSPAPGATVQLNDTAPTKDPWNFAAVEILPSPIPTTVPLLVGKTQQDAARAITNAGLSAESATTFSDTVPAGIVISQAPVAGTVVDDGSLVSFLVSSGPKPQAVWSDSRTVQVTTSGPALLVAFAAADGGASAQTLTVSGGGLPWKLVRRANGQHGTAEIWSAVATQALSSVTITAAEGRSGYPQSLTVVAFDGATGVGASAAGSGNDTAPWVSLVTLKPNSLVYGVGIDPSNDVTPTLNPSLVFVHEWPNPAGDDDFWVVARNGSVPAAGTTVTVNAISPTNDRWNLAAAEIQFQ